MKVSEEDSETNGQPQGAGDREVARGIVSCGDKRPQRKTGSRGNVAPV